MTLPYSLPDWVPWWVNIAILVPVVLFALAFLLMPFSVIGVKGRLESVEARLDEIQGEIRSLALRLPDPGPREMEIERPPRAWHHRLGRADAAPADPASAAPWPSWTARRRRTAGSTPRAGSAPSLASIRADLVVRSAP